MKRSVLAMLMSALLICCLVLPVGAETVVRDGIEVTLTTDKESYSDLEVINAKLTIRNTNDYPIQNVRTEITVPEGYKLLDSGTMKIGTLAAGAEQVLQTNMRNLEADIPDLPQTGDDSHGGLWLLLMMLSGILLGIVIVKHKQANRVVSLFLCVAIISSFTLTAIPVYAETTEKAITVTKEVAVDGKRAVITGIVIYDYDVEMSATPTPTPTPTPTATPNTSALDYEYSISNGRVTILK